MDYRHINFDNYKVDAALSAFISPRSEGGVNEYNAILRGTDPTVPFAQQIANIEHAVDELKRELGSDVAPVMMRYLLSDPTNQASLIPQSHGCAVSVIGQAPLDGTKAALWVYLQSDVKVSHTDSYTAAEHGPYTHYWHTGSTMPLADTRTATEKLLQDYTDTLASNGCTLEANCQRTWFFVRDVDNNYHGVVEGRNLLFAAQGLTADTHFIASTGISGNAADPHALVSMDSYAVKGIRPAQVSYLKASDYLNPTAEYGVAFERGTALRYGDRRHLLISGTASINNRGEVMYPGDIIKQSERMLQNIEALVREGECQMSDLTHLIIYLRDTADYAVVSDFFGRRFPLVPKVIVLAPVCRPGWLIEVECMAIGTDHNPEFEPF